MSKEEESISWLSRIKQLLHLEPQNKEQLVELLRDAQIRALIDEATLAMLEGALIFAQMQVRDIMLPKKQMVCVSEEDALNDIIHTVTGSGHSRFPVMNASKDEVIGILHAKDLLRFHEAAGLAFDLHDIIRQPSIVPASKRLDSLLSEFRVNRNHMAIVVDEYGTVAGFVTLEDLIEQIIGDIADEFDIDEEAYIKIHANAHYIIKAHTPIEEFNEQLQTNFSDEDYDTIGGIVMANFGHLPRRGETIVINKFEFKVINADARRINLLECFDRRDHMQARSVES